VYITIAEHDRVVAIVLDRPDRRNSLDGDGWRFLAETVRRQEARQKVRAILLRSTGPVFCGGADLGWMRGAPEAELAAAYDALEAIRRCPKPVVCRVQGPTFGGGVGLVAAADVAISDADATFTLSEVRLGIAPALISRFVVERVGAARFRSWALLGRQIDASSALAAGLVDHVATEQGLDAAVDEALDAIRRGEPEAISTIKRFGPRGLERDEAAATLARLRDRPEFAEGVAALREGREPEWTARDPSEEPT
jgi:methylglutaconyl-CoA hydratase